MGRAIRVDPCKSSAVGRSAALSRVSGTFGARFLTAVDQVVATGRHSDCDSLFLGSGGHVRRMATTG